jgi:3-deoxy-D-manno-octulosonic-acid transferase
LKGVFPNAIFFSAIKEMNVIPAGARVIVIDNIGMLSRLYHYAYITYIGGGFGKGIHNTLEAAVHGKPVLFGPAYHKFREAKELISIEAGFAVNDENECGKVIDFLVQHEEDYREKCDRARKYVVEKTGATEKILQFIQENRLLTR